jgi:hypothetical protein
MYSKNLHDTEFVRLMQNTINGSLGLSLKTLKRINGMLLTVIEENNFRPFFFLPNRLAKVIRCPTPPLRVLQDVLLQLGYRSGRSHCRPGSVKTDAPWHVLWEIMRLWKKKTDLSGNSASYYGAETVKRRLFIIENIKFPGNGEKIPEKCEDQDDIVFYNLNPAGWGPRSRATGSRSQVWGGRKVFG